MMKSKVGVDAEKNLSKAEIKNTAHLEISVVANNQLVSDRTNSDQNSVTSSEVNLYFNFFIINVITSSI